MAWIKRNLYFVITIVVGMGVTGYCGYLAYAALGDNATASEAYATAASSLDQLQKKVPYPSKENIAVAEADAARVKAFQVEFRKPFSGFPTPPKLDDREFNAYLHKCVSQFGLDATNAGVGLPPNYAFTFSQQMDIFAYPNGCIPPWMQELEEIKAILHIIYKAKINYLDQIRRPPVYVDEAANGNDILFPTNIQPWGVVSPYYIQFRAFSSEIANVLSGIASSSNCFIVKAIFVKPSMFTPDFVDTQPEAAPVLMQNRLNPATSRQFDQGFGPQGGRGRGERELGMERRQQQMRPAPETAAPPGPSAPVVILREKPLSVTIYLDVVKLKSPDAPAPAAKARTAGR
jgi:hypothetical protein